MINANDSVKLTGSVASTGTGSFTVSVSEFFVDGAWHKLETPRELEINTSDYTNDFTSLELKYIKEKAEADSKSSTLCEDDLEIVNSIVKKFSSAATDV